MAAISALQCCARAPLCAGAEPDIWGMVAEDIACFTCHRISGLLVSIAAISLLRFLVA